MRFRFHLVAVLGLIAALLAVAGSTSTARADTTARPLKVVLLGDSYSAGNGARDKDGNRDYYGPDGCYRSKSNWAEQYVGMLKASGYNVTFVNRACSGGVTKDLVLPRDMEDTKTRWMSSVPGITTNEQALAYVRTQDPCNDRAYLDEQYWTYPNATLDGGSIVFNCKRWLRPQTDFVGADTDLVLFTNGGNDVHFSNIVTQCFAVGPRDPAGCEEAVTNAYATLPSVKQGILSAVAKMRDNHLRSDARIVLLGYPLLALDNGYDLSSGVWKFKRTYAVANEVRKFGLFGDSEQTGIVAEANVGHPGQMVHLSGIPALFEGHEPDGRATERNPNRWIHEFETRIKMEWYHPNPQGHYEYARKLFGGGTYGTTGTATKGGDLDVVFVVDTTGSMAGDIDAARQYAVDLVNYVNSQTNSARFALVSYRDHPDWTGEDIDYPSRLDQGFTNDGPTMQAALGRLEADGGGDWEETMYSGIQEGLNLPWRAGVKKVVIVLADAPPQEPEHISGLSATQVIQHAMAVDPAAIYGVDTSGADYGGHLTQLADGTGGQVFSADGSIDVPAALHEIATDAIKRPYAWINGPYVAPVGRPITLDASGSYAVSGSIASYAWDFDADGVTDQTTTTPEVTHTWGAPFSGLVGLTVTDSNGFTSLANTHVGITRDGDEIPDAEDNCPDVDNMGQEDEDKDGIGDMCDPTPGFPTVDKPGVYEGRGIVATTAPTIQGKVRAGRRVTVNTGVWTGSPTLKVQWTRDGKPIAKATSTSYVPAKADIGHKLAATVTASAAGLPDGVGTSKASVVGKYAANLKVKASKTSRLGTAAKVTMRLKVPGLKRKVGKVVIRDGKRVVATVRIKAKAKGRATVKVTGLKLGRHILKVSYRGNKVTAKATRKIRITVRR